MAVTSSDRGKLRNRMSRPTGVIIAPPKPWITRISTSTGRLDDKPHRPEPMVNSASAPANTRRVPKRSANQELTGMNTARLRM